MYSNELICKILIFIDQNINRQITMDELSLRFFFNKDYIMRLFKKELGITIITYINKKRIYNSLNELKNTNNSMTRIALNNGFNSQEYYSEIFHSIMGTSPITYRKFTKIITTISPKEEAKLKTNLINLSILFHNIEAYRKNTPTKEVKTLSLFKQ